MSAPMSAPMGAPALSTIGRPGPGEYAEWYAPYLAALGDADPLEALVAQGDEWRALLAGLDDAGARQRYAPGKWSVKEVLGHVCDAERVFSYRALRIARSDETPLAGFDENAWVPVAGFDARPLAELAAEREAVRAATLALFRGLDRDAWTRAGSANGQRVTVRALLFICAGHERHHQRVLRERYGLG